MPALSRFLICIGMAALVAACGDWKQGDAQADASPAPRNEEEMAAAIGQAIADLAHRLPESFDDFRSDPITDDEDCQEHVRCWRSTFGVPTANGYEAASLVRQRERFGNQVTSHVIELRGTEPAAERTVRLIAAAVGSSLNGFSLDDPRSPYAEVSMEYQWCRQVDDGLVDRIEVLRGGYTSDWVIRKFLEDDRLIMIHVQRDKTEGTRCLAAPAGFSTASVPAIADAIADLVRRLPNTYDDLKGESAVDRPICEIDVDCWNSKLSLPDVSGMSGEIREAKRPEAAMRSHVIRVRGTEAVDDAASAFIARAVDLKLDDFPAYGAVEGFFEHVWCRAGHDSSDLVTLSRGGHGVDLVAREPLVDEHTVVIDVIRMTGFEASQGTATDPCLEMTGETGR